MSTQMANNSTLKLKLETGINAKGAATYSTKSGINPGLTDDELLGVADGLAGLQSHALAEVDRVDTSTLA